MVKTKKIKSLILILISIILLSTTTQISFLVSHNFIKSTSYRQSLNLDVASTETTIIRPNGNGAFQWESSDFSRINEDIEQPNQTDGIVNFETRILTHTDIFYMSNPSPTGGDRPCYVKELKLWFYGRAVNYLRNRIAKLTLDVKMGGEWLGGKTIKQTGGWFSKIYSGYWDPDQVDDIQVKAIAYIQSPSNEAFVLLDCVYIEVTYERPPVKIGVFFWPSDGCLQSTIDNYKSFLIAEGYTKFFDFKNSDNFQVDFNTVDNYELDGDIVFFYLLGHGNYTGTDSYTYFKVGKQTKIYSSQFRLLMDGLETNKKGFLIESCRSGGWVEDFQSATYLAMSTTNTTALARSIDYTEGKFSYYFWREGVHVGKNAIESFYYADAVNLEFSNPDEYPPYLPHPQISQYWIYQDAQIYIGSSSYNFFAD